MEEARGGSESESTPVFQPVCFPIEGQNRLFGWFHPPRVSVARRCGVVLCNPFAAAALGTHRSYRRFAEAFAAAGYPAVRFDYDGTGDSAGNDGDPQRMRAWTGSVRAAIDLCKRLGAVDSVVLLGLRFGGTLAVLAAEGRSDVAGLALWSPAWSGRKFVRELKMLNATSAAGLAAGSTAPASADGRLEAAGFLHEAATIAHMGAVNLMKVPVRVPRAVLLTRDDDSPEEDYRDSLRSQGVAVSEINVPGYAAMMQDAQYSVVPVAAIEAVCGWLQQNWPEAADAGRSPEALQCPDLDTGKRADDGDLPVLERYLRFGDDGELFGILSFPEPSQELANRTAVIFVNAGGNHRIGPSRLNVVLSRFVASLGHIALRMDVGGLGDSLRTVEPLPIFSLDSVPDVCKAIDLLATLGDTPPQRTVIVGLCSGGYLTMHTASQDARVSGQIVLNQPVFEFDAEGTAGKAAQAPIKPIHFYTTALFRLDTWKRLLTGNIDYPRIIRSGSAKLHERFIVRNLALLHRLGLVRDHSVVARFRALGQRGVNTFLIYSENDGAIDEMETHLGKDAELINSDPNFKLVILKGADHTFTGYAARQSLLTLFRRHFEQIR